MKAFLMKLLKSFGLKMNDNRFSPFKMLGDGLMEAFKTAVLPIKEDINAVSKILKIIWNIVKLLGNFFIKLVMFISGHIVLILASLFIAFLIGLIAGIFDFSYDYVVDFSGIENEGLFNAVQNEQMLKEGYYNMVAETSYYQVFNDFNVANDNEDYNVLDNFLQWMNNTGGEATLKEYNTEYFGWSNLDDRLIVHDANMRPMGNMKKAKSATEKMDGIDENYFRDHYGRENLFMLSPNMLQELNNALIKKYNINKGYDMQAPEVFTKPVHFVYDYMRIADKTDIYGDRGEPYVYVTQRVTRDDIERGLYSENQEGLIKSNPSLYVYEYAVGERNTPETFDKSVSNNLAFRNVSEYVTKQNKDNGAREIVKLYYKVTGDGENNSYIDTFGVPEGVVTFDGPYLSFENMLSGTGKLVSGNSYSLGDGETWTYTKENNPKPRRHYQLAPLEAKDGADIIASSRTLVNNQLFKVPIVKKNYRNSPQYVAGLTEYMNQYKDFYSGMEDWTSKIGHAFESGIFGDGDDIVEFDDTAKFEAVYDYEDYLIFGFSRATIGNKDFGVSASEYISTLTETNNYQALSGENVKSSNEGDVWEYVYDIKYLFKTDNENMQKLDIERVKRYIEIDKEYNASLKWNDAYDVSNSFSIYDSPRYGYSPQGEASLGSSYFPLSVPKLGEPKVNGHSVKFSFFSAPAEIMIGEDINGNLRKGEMSLLWNPQTESYKKSFVNTTTDGVNISTAQLVNDLRYEHRNQTEIFNTTTNKVFDSSLNQLPMELKSVRDYGLSSILSYIRGVQVTYSSGIYFDETYNNSNYSGDSMIKFLEQYHNDDLRTALNTDFLNGFYPEELFEANLPHSNGTDANSDETFLSHYVKDYKLNEEAEIVSKLLKDLKMDTGTVPEKINGGYSLGEPVEYDGHSVQYILKENGDAENLVVARIINGVEEITPFKLFGPNITDDSLFFKDKSHPFIDEFVNPVKYYKAWTDRKRKDDTSTWWDDFNVFKPRNDGIVLDVKNPENINSTEFKAVSNFGENLKNSKDNPEMDNLETFNGEMGSFEFIDTLNSNEIMLIEEAVTFLGKFNYTYKDTTTNSTDFDDKKITSVFYADKYFEFEEVGGIILGWDVNEESGTVDSLKDDEADDEEENVRSQFEETFGKKYDEGDEVIISFSWERDDSTKTKKEKKEKDDNGVWQVVDSWFEYDYDYEVEYKVRVKETLEPEDVEKFYKKNRTSLRFFKDFNLDALRNNQELQPIETFYSNLGVTLGSKLYGFEVNDKDETDISDVVTVNVPTETQINNLLFGFRDTYKKITYDEVHLKILKNSEDGNTYNYDTLNGVPMPIYRYFIGSKKEIMPKETGIYFDGETYVNWTTRLKVGEKSIYGDISDADKIEERHGYLSYIESYLRNFETTISFNTASNHDFRSTAEDLYSKFIPTDTKIAERTMQYNSQFKKYSSTDYWNEMLDNFQLNDLSRDESNTAIAQILQGIAETRLDKLEGKTIKFLNKKYNDDFDTAETKLAIQSRIDEGKINEQYITVVNSDGDEMTVEMPYVGVMSLKVSSLGVYKPLQSNDYGMILNVQTPNVVINGFQDASNPSKSIEFVSVKLVRLVKKYGNIAEALYATFTEERFVDSLKIVTSNTPANKIKYPQHGYVMNPTEDDIDHALLRYVSDISDVNYDYLKPHSVTQALSYIRNSVVKVDVATSAFTQVSKSKQEKVLAVYSNYKDTIDYVCEKWGLDRALFVAKIYQESSGNPKAGRARAGWGLGQIQYVGSSSRSVTATTASGQKETITVQLTLNEYTDERVTDIPKALEWSAAYYKNLLDTFNGDSLLALQGYNMGPAVARDLYDGLGDSWASQLASDPEVYRTYVYPYAKKQSSERKLNHFLDNYKWGQKLVWGDPWYTKNVLRYYIEGIATGTLKIPSMEGTKVYSKYDKEFDKLLKRNDYASVNGGIQEIQNHLDADEIEILLRSVYVKNTEFTSSQLSDFGEDQAKIVTEVPIYMYDIFNLLGKGGARLSSSAETTPLDLEILEELDVYGREDYQSPMKGDLTLTSAYGYRIHPVHKDKRFHTGLDIVGKSDKGLYSIAYGKVIFSGDNGGYGYRVVIAHPTIDDDFDNPDQEWLVSTYNHLQTASGLRYGDTVNAGTFVGIMGNSGTTSGSNKSRGDGTHLHFEVLTKYKDRKGNVYIANEGFRENTYVRETDGNEFINPFFFAVPKPDSNQMKFVESDMK